MPWRQEVSALNRITQLCKELRIADLDSLSADIIFKDPEQYVTELLELALKQRFTKRVQRLVQQAHFPGVDMRQEYIFDRITFPASIDRKALMQLQFLEHKENLCLFGPCGTGKTRLAVMLGLKACQEGKFVRFYRTIDLVNSLVEAYDKGQVKQMLERIAKCHILVLDEIGYIPFSKKAAEMLFSVISQGYEEQTIVTTSNLEFGRWNEIFGDDRLIAAIIDRIVHRSHILGFSGPSRRLEEAIVMRGKQPAVQPALAGKGRV